jgi:hypothetical protein
MATRKKKTTVIESADIAEMTNISNVVKGNHLTVTTFSDGTTKLEWDDEALLNEVREAIAGAKLTDLKSGVREKVATRKKKEKQGG